MADRSFAHLHLHTHYSLLDGFNRIPELVAQTKALGMNACAITDHGNLYGAIEFYTKCKEGGINPIIGYEAYVAPGFRGERSGKQGSESAAHLTLLAQNATGFRNLIKLSSIAFTEGFYYKPRIDRAILEAHSEGLICLSGCLAGEFNQFILKDRKEEAEKLAKWFHKIFKKNFYIEIQNNGIGLQDLCTPVAAEIGDKLGIPLVATADAHYMCADDAIAHDVLFCIHTRKEHNPFKKAYPEEKMANPYYVRSPKDMYKLFPDYADAVQRSQTIADSVDIQLDFKKRHFPVFITPKEMDADDYLRELCLQGVAERYGATPTQQVHDRLDLELGIIKKMGYAGYFLIVWDFVRFAREQGIPSTARGSGCGAIVAYVLYMSHVCPLEYDLLFERFLDPNRSEPPDIDIDFCQERRELVIQYVKQKYGKDSVAQIGTFGTLAAKAALKDVGRVMKIPLERVNYMCKLVPMQGAIAKDLKEAMQVADFKKEYHGDSVTRQWIDIAMKLEGTNRNVGTHAAGVVIASGPITDYVPVQRVMRKADNEEGETKDGGEIVITTQWEMGVLEKVGMLKMDFLGLRNLTVLDNAVKMIARIRGETLDPMTFDLTDEATYKLLQRGDAKGVFQLESDGIRELLKQMRPDNIRDLIAVLALYRPGPLKGGMVDSYVNRKHGKEKWTYPHPVMAGVLDETYGVFVYQEQIMRILNRLGGIELSKAYAVIKAISKKIPEKIEAGREDFLKGALASGVARPIAEEIFEKIVFFAGYGFNKCVVAETEVPDADTGEMTTVGELFDTGRAMRVHALGDDGKLRPRAITDVVCNGRKKVYRLRTQLGHEILTTANHPFRTLDGWTNLEDLNVDDRIATPRKLSIDSRESWSPHELEAMANYLSERDAAIRSERRVPPEVFCLRDSDIAYFLDRLFENISTRPLFGPERADPSAQGEALGSGARLFCPGKAVRRMHLELPLQGRSALAVCPGLRLGLMDRPFQGRRVNPQTVVLSSKRLAKDIQHLLLRFGIISRVLDAELQIVNTSESPSAGSDVFWDRVESIEPVGIRNTYDLTVEEDHNFVAEGMIVHNSHTAAYAQIGFQTAYLKTHYTAEYMAALLSSEIDDGNKRDIMVDHIADARKLGVEVEAPNVNKGQPDFDVVNGKIIFGLTAIKGLGRGAAIEIVRAREDGGPFRHLFDFCERVDLRIVKQAQIEKLIKGGAMDCFGKNNRNATLQTLPRAVQAADDQAVDKRRGQKSIFDGMDDEITAVSLGGVPGGLKFSESLNEAKEWDDLTKLKFEKEVLDFYMSSHPLSQFDDQLRRFRTHDASQLAKASDRSEARLGGMITNLSVRTNKSNKRFALFRLEDFTGSVKCCLWSDELAKFQDLVKDDSIALFEGILEHGDRPEPDFMVKKIFTLDDAKKELTRGVLLRMNYRSEESGRELFESVARLLQKSKGQCPVYLAIRDTGGKSMQFKLNNEFFVNPNNLRVEELEMVLGAGSVIYTGR